MSIPPPLATQERLRLALAAGRMGTWYWDLTAGTVDWDEYLEEIHGLEPGTFPGTFDAYLELIHPDDRALAIEQSRRTLATGEDHYVEHRVVLADGSIKWISGSGRVVRDESGTPIGMVGVGADLTHRRLLEERGDRATRAADLSQRRLRLLARAGEVLTSSLDPNVTLQRVADLAVETGLADWCAVDLADGDAVVNVATAHRDPERLHHTNLLRDRYPQSAEERRRGPIGTGKPVLYREIPDAMVEESARNPEHLELLRNLRMQSAIAAPILTADATIVGVITFVNESMSSTYDEEDLELAVALATRASAAFETASVFSERDRVATALQRSLLPPTLPVIPGVELGSAYSPAGGDLGISGDFYDVFPITNTRHCLVVGDVCGKGPDAAAVTAAVRYFIRSAGARHTCAEDILRDVNDALRREQLGERFTTATIVLVDHEPGADVVAEVASAGHPPVLLRDAAGEVESLKATGPALGLLPEAHFATCRVALPAGSTVVLYTDGLTESRRHDDFFGEDRLQVAIAGAAPGAQSVADALMATTTAFGTPRDDRAILVLTVR